MLRATLQACTVHVRTALYNIHSFNKLCQIHSEVLNTSLVRVQRRRHGRSILGIFGPHLNATDGVRIEFASSAQKAPSSLTNSPLDLAIGKRWCRLRVFNTVIESSLIGETERL